MTLNELRIKCKRKSDYLITIVVTNELSLLLTLMILKTKITPNAVTVSSIISAGICSFLYSFGEFLFGSFFLFLSHLLDCTDGNLARARNQFSLIGRWLDMVVDRLSHSIIIVGVSIYFFKLSMYSWVYVSLLDVILLLNYYYAVDLGISQELHKVNGKEKMTKLFIIKGVPIKIGLYEPIIYGFVVLAPLGMIKYQIIFIFIASIFGIIFQIYSKIKIA